MAPCSQTPSLSALRTCSTREALSSHGTSVHSWQQCSSAQRNTCATTRAQDNTTQAHVAGAGDAIANGGTWRGETLHDGASTRRSSSTVVDSAERKKEGRSAPPCTRRTTATPVGRPGSIAPSSQTSWPGAAAPIDALPVRRRLSFIYRGHTYRRVNGRGPVPRRGPAPPARIASLWVLAQTRVRIIELNLAILGAPEG